jgi:hypothetical protein
MLTPPVPRNRPSFEPWLAMSFVLCLGGALALFDLDHLTSAVLAAARADVMRALHVATALAGHELRGGDEVVTTTIALMRAANALLWKCTHDVSS